MSSLRPRGERSLLLELWGTRGADEPGRPGDDATAPPGRGSAPAARALAAAACAVGRAGHMPLCPVCCVGALAVTEVRGALGLGHHGALVCPRCGATLVQDKHDSSRFELASTKDTSLPKWRSYAHQTLSVSESYYFGHGGHLDAEQHKADLAAAKQQQEADLAEAMVELRDGRIRLEAAANSPVLLNAGEQASSSCRRQPARISLGDPRRLRWPLNPRGQDLPCASAAFRRKATRSSSRSTSAPWCSPQSDSAFPAAALAGGDLAG